MDKAENTNPNAGLDNQFLLPPRLKALADLCASGAGRYSMAGVLLKRTPDGYEACATDGRILGRVRGEFPEMLEHYPDLPGMGHNPEGAAPQALVPAKDWKEGFGLGPKLGRYHGKPVLENVRVRTLKDETQFGATDLSKSRVVTVRNEEGRFPDYESVIPADKGRAGMSVNAALLIKLLKVAVAFDGTEAGKVRLELCLPKKGKAGQPMLLVKSQGRHEQFTGLLVALSEPGEEEGE